MEDVNIINALLENFNIKFDKFEKSFLNEIEDQSNPIQLGDIDREYIERIMKSKTVAIDNKKNIKEIVCDVSLSDTDITDTHSKIFDQLYFIYNMKQLMKVIEFRYLEIEYNLQVIYYTNASYEKMNQSTRFIKYEISKVLTKQLIDEITREVDESEDLSTNREAIDVKAISNNKSYTIEDYKDIYKNTKLVEKCMIEDMNNTDVILKDVCRYMNLKKKQESMKAISFIDDVAIAVVVNLLQPMTNDEKQDIINKLFDLNP